MKEKSYDFSILIFSFRMQNARNEKKIAARKKWKILIKSRRHV